MGALRSVADLVCSAVAVAGGLLLLWAGLGHAREFGRLRATLLSHGLLPGGQRRAGAAVLVAAEVGVGGAVITGVLSSLRGSSALPSRLVLPAMVGEALVYTGFLAYLTVLRRVRPGAACGCLSGDGPVRAPVLVRAGVFAVAAAVTAPLARNPTPFLGSLTGLGRLASVSVLVPALVLAVLAALLPGSLRVASAAQATSADAPGGRPLAQPSSRTTSLRRQ
ncbi:MauE/DoxX family redox-associated membrane protein [Actinopolymorpha singaporensis]|uniref:Methylamine utilisation protein MauE domain-containing protein n=1 Tax=Actinopolymorpha singaporensis TaxID=117157 RepID=A0A1H1L9S1_9ACTN|nr:MauE/DoxX family redox-associated membrane protein [Actinopolymorpha singaporensis]SDR71167.1 hypothetical protein SAMN04489717_0204 [Actinopolymorpha singaporensis]